MLKCYYPVHLCITSLHAEIVSAAHAAHDEVCLSCTIDYLLDFTNFVIRNAEMYYMVCMQNSQSDQR